MPWRKHRLSVAGRVLDGTKLYVLDTVRVSTLADEVAYSSSTPHKMLYMRSFIARSNSGRVRFSMPFPFDFALAGTSRCEGSERSVGERLGKPTLRREGKDAVSRLVNTPANTQRTGVETF